MAYEHRPNTGTLFKNDHKQQDSHPDYRGECLVNGQLLEMAAWIKEGKSGRKFLSFSFKEPWQKPGVARIEQEKGDDVPW